MIPTHKKEFLVVRILEKDNRSWKKLSDIIDALKNEEIGKSTIHHHLSQLVKHDKAEKRYETENNRPVPYYRLIDKEIDIEELICNYEKYKWIERVLSPANLDSAKAKDLIEAGKKTERRRERYKSILKDLIIPFSTEKTSQYIVDDDEFDEEAEWEFEIDWREEFELLVISQFSKFALPENIPITQEEEDLLFGILIRQLNHFLKQDKENFAKFAKEKGLDTSELPFWLYHRLFSANFGLGIGYLGLNQEEQGFFWDNYPKLILDKMSKEDIPEEDYEYVEKYLQFFKSHLAKFE
ncbi:MAG: hypothetical protein ACE5OZ_24245 [Candidatus Heimdallarchaeota archaeon]